MPLFERDLQLRRLRSDASLTDLFVHLHGMIFSKVQLDDFDKIMARFEEQLQSLMDKDNNDVDKTLHHGMSLSNWMMMATINIASLLQYSTESLEQATLKMTIASSEQMEDIASKVSNTVAEVEQPDDEEDEEEAEEEEEEEDEDDNDDATLDKEVETDTKGTATPHAVEETPITLQCAARLTFAILKKLILKLVGGAKHQSMGKVNPYITMLLTFLSQECKQSDLLGFMEPFIPWKQLLQLGNNVPKPLDPIDPRKEVALRVRGHGSPLAEDWCLRGMAWVGRRVYERGFWKGTKGGSNGRTTSTLHFESEIEVLNQFSASTSHQEDSISGESGEEGEDTEGGANQSRGEQQVSMSMLRWKRLVYTLTVLIKTVPGLDYLPNSGQLTLTSPLKEKVQGWEVEQNFKEQGLYFNTLKLKDKQQTKQVSTSASDEDDDEYSEDEEGNEDLSDESDTIRDLKRRRRALRDQLRESKIVAMSGQAFSKSKDSDSFSFKKHTTMTKKPIRMELPILKGYTILMLDTNVMLTPISILEKLVESQRWCTVVPLVTVTELEGLTKRSGIIGQRAQRAIDYLSNNLKAKTSYLKVLTSRGNYLSDLHCRTEEIDFSKIPATGGVEKEDENHHRTARSIDEVIIHCLEWQTNHFLDRSAILLKDPEEMRSVQSQVSKETYKAALITLDKNLRLKARFRGLVALGPNAIVNLLEPDSSTLIQ